MSLMKTGMKMVILATLLSAGFSRAEDRSPAEPATPAGTPLDPEYDYEVPAPGSYELPVIQAAADGTVLGADGTPTSLHDIMRDHVVVLSFIYTRCSDPKACMRATGVLSQLQRISRQQSGLAKKLLLVSLSFDPSFDRPEVMARYGRVSLGSGDGAEWLFLTTRNQKDLQPLLEAYGQRVDRRKTFSALGPLYHSLRVYLIDPRQQVRNIYSYGLLDPRLVVNDVLTLVAEANETPVARATGDKP
jgi:cytochrome oxidase Cu insertion factor (SCO1/SenC/PrrC family)